MKPRTLTSILVSKILDVLESSTLSQIFSGFLLLLASIIVTVVLTYTNDSIEAFRAILAWENAIIMKGVVVTLFIFNFSKILALILEWFESLLATHTDIRTIDSIDGIPRLELMDHLFTVWTFKRDEVESKWAIPRYRVTAMSKKLEDLGVLIRWENNSRILNPEYTRSDLATLLGNHESVDNIRILTRKTDGWFSHRPSGSEVLQRMSPFVTRPL